MCSESSWRTRIARGLSVKRWGTAAVAAPAAGYHLVASGVRLVAIIARAYHMLVANGYELVAAGRRLEDRPLLNRRAEEWWHSGAPLCSGARAVGRTGLPNCA